MDFNQLRPDQAEAIHCLQEEEGELLQALGKVCRHGWDSSYVIDGARVDNRADVEREAGHVLAWLAVLIATQIRAGQVRKHAAQKLQKLHEGRGADAVGFGLLHHVPREVLEDAVGLIMEARVL